MRIRGFLILFPLFLPVLGGCTDLGYYLQAASGHFDLLRQKQDIAELLENPGTDAELKRKLQLLKEVREFASAKMALPESPGYTGYVDLGRPYVTMVVRAAPEFSLESYRWCYWFIGCQEYRGYFNEHEARAYAANMEPGLDISVRPVSAYSTLGWLNGPWIPDFFSDPVLNTFMNRRDPEIVGTLIHEMAHQMVFVEGDTPFNESFAVFVEQEGVLNFYRKRGDIHTEDYLWYLSAQKDRERFRQMILETFQKLENLYQEKLSEDEMRKRKTKQFLTLKRKFAEEKSQFEVLNYEGWFKQDLNNTHILGVRRYHRDTGTFRRLFESEGRKWPSFYRKVQALADETAEKRSEFLQSKR